MTKTTEVSKSFMRWHVLDLCKKHGIECFESAPSGKGKAWVSHRKIQVGKISSVISYIVALHEIGHIMDTENTDRQEREVFAWDWAIRNTMVWNDRCQEKMEQCLASYVIGFAKKRIRMSHSMKKHVPILRPSCEFEGTHCGIRFGKKYVANVPGGIVDGTPVRGRVIWKNYVETINTVVEKYFTV